MENWIPLSMMIFSFLIFVSDKIFMLFESKNSDEASGSLIENEEKTQ